MTDDSTSDAQVFLSALFDGYRDSPEWGSLRCEVRALVPRGETSESRPPRGWWELSERGIEAAAKTSVLWSRTHDVYCGVLPRLGRKGSAADVLMSRWLFADIDGGEEGPEGSAELVDRAAMPKPHMAVRSGGGLHCYWHLSEAVDTSTVGARLDFKGVLRRIVHGLNLARGISELMNRGINSKGESPTKIIPTLAHADESAAEVARILRVPGTQNLKQADNPRPVQLVHLDLSARSYSLEAWKESLPSVPIVREKAPPKHYTTSDGLSEGLIRWARTPYPEGKRHKDLAGAAAWLVRDANVPKNVAEELLLMKAQASVGSRRIDEEEVRKMIRWA
jgi:hypothetical protein